ncbi:hypothetical protein Xen7305DRAFT_00043980 [Xenococcus sp. PCC 7305]|uniref:DUF502 domain-containing protein n=1 Tax=Xenococcus sp. PCC 7305 TaxID=102125 RepID=UPI0002AC219C|nr:DUF502 domain-containing protein [Xenococcus sp. PCC 7305]ELS04662.1 hypothetical protein Xen7305DRAFT_00043980 [Xenococcus sp. PCC 7305]
MKNFIEKTIIGGLFFLIPVVVAIAILGKALKIMKSISVPLSEALGADSVKDVLFVNSLTVFCLIALCFIAGLFSSTPLGKKLFQALDAFLQKFIPGYTYLKNMTSEFDVNQSVSSFKPVLIRLDDQSQIAFEVERTETEQVVVFLPGSPDPRSGTVILMDSDRVTPIDASFLSVSSTLKRFGRDTQVLLRK